MFEPVSPFTEVHLARDARVHHPLQRAIDGGPADPGVFSADQIDEFVGRDVPFLPEEDLNDEVALAGAPTTGRPPLFDKLGRGLHTGARPLRR